MEIVSIISWYRLAEWLADFVAWLLRSDTPKHIVPQSPSGHPDYFNVMIATGVVLVFAFFYLCCGCIYQLLVYRNRIFLRTKIMLILHAVFCFSASCIVSLRLYSYWYDDVTGTISAYSIFTGIIVVYTIVVSVFEILVLREPTKKEYGDLAETVKEVARKHGLDK